MSVEEICGAYMPRAKATCARKKKHGGNHRSVVGVERQREHDRRYATSEKGRARDRRKNATEKGRTRTRRYAASEKGRERKRRSNAKNPDRGAKRWPVYAEPWRKIVSTDAVYAKTDYACAYCGSAPATVPDHVFSRANGGPDIVENLLGSCPACNGAKSSRDAAWIPADVYRKYLGGIAAVGGKPTADWS